MYNYHSTVGNSPSLLSGFEMEGANGAAVWAIVAFVLALVGAFVVYFIFVKAKNGYDNKFLSWLRDFLDFQSMLIEPILKISYIFMALLITLESFTIISTSFLSFLIFLVFGNILMRVIYEASMVLLGIWKNTTDINKKLK